ncbi:MAG TPA: hypothetical protein VHR85_05295, partial [Nocardioides sp.]|nr:hypothetical protein [Nocardioides sp.]
GLRGDVVASLGISGPTARLAERLDELGRHLLDQSTALSSLLRGPARPDATRPDPARTDPARPDPARPDTARTDTARTHSARAAARTQEVVA